MSEFMRGSLPWTECQDTVEAKTEENNDGTLHEFACHPLRLFHPEVRGKVGTKVGTAQPITNRICSNFVPAFRQSLNRTGPNPERPSVTLVT